MRAGRPTRATSLRRSPQSSDGHAGLLRTRPTRNAPILVVWALLPIATILIVSIWKPVEPARYYAYAVLPASLLIGVALDALRRRAGVVVATPVLVFLAAGGIAQMALYHGEDWRSAAAIVGAASPGDAVVVYSANVMRPLRYALRERGACAFIRNCAIR